ncbi:MAG: hypothetical protein ACRETN_00180 [Nevskiales bacterium]
MTLSTGASGAAGHPVDTLLHGQPVRTIVDSELAQYALAHYFSGERLNPAHDATLDALLQGLPAGPPERESLARITQAHSADLATALVAERLLREPRNRLLQELFARSVEDLDSGKKPAMQPIYRVLFAPGWLYQRNPKSGADFAKPRKVLTTMGIDNALLPTLESGTIEENAHILAEQIRRYSESGRPLILVSASKAGPEVGEALALLTRRKAPHRVRAWVNIGGILQGSPLADRAAHAPLRWIAALLAPVKGWNLASIDNMRTAISRERFRNWRLPRELLAINFLGVPFSGNITAAADYGYQKMKTLGPNDGLTLLPDAIAPNSVTIVQLGLDHYYLDPRIDIKTAALAQTVMRRLDAERP